MRHRRFFNGGTGARLARNGIAAVCAALASPAVFGGAFPGVQTVFLIVVENRNWADFKGNTNAPYLNGVLLPMASYCEEYYNPPGLHPSLPNYLWLEAGTNFGILDNQDSSVNHRATTNHLVSRLKRAGISWKTYQEDIGGDDVPLTDTNQYAVRHNPFVFFNDVTGNNDPNHAYGIAHIRPYEELAGDLTNNAVARYNFIKPNLCNDGHDDCPPLNNGVAQTDAWLARELPKILASQAYSNGGAVFITWDEGPASSDGPIGLVVLSRFARGGGYFNKIQYTHSSMVRTLQEIFGVGPPMRDAANATDLRDLFSRFAITDFVRLTNGGLRLTASGVIPGRTNLVQASADLTAWTSISTNVSSTNTFVAVVAGTNSSGRCHYRLLQLP